MAAGLTLAFIAATSSPALADQVRRSEWWLRALHVTNAWQTTRGSGVTIAVLDTGVAPAQADLTGSVTTGPDYTHSGRTAGGQFWGIHGTEVASLIAGHGHGPGQANGIIGIAPAARILSVRVTLESNDPSLSSQAVAAGLPAAIARGITWAVRHDASVIDLPVDPVTTAGAPGSGGSHAERAAVNYALAKHVVLVAPAGDGGAGTDPVNYPAAYHGVIAVGAFDRQFIKAPFTSHQPYVTVTAAGAGVTAASPSGGYPQVNSTSAASAMVAGIVALIQAQFPELTPAQITRALTTSTVYHPAGGRADGSGFGTVDAVKALTAAAAIAEDLPKTDTSGTASQVVPTPPAVHRSPIHRNIQGALVKDAVIAGAVFLLLLGLIFAIAAWRRRKARSARLAEVRAAVQPPVRKPVMAGTTARGPVVKGTAGAQADPDTEVAERQLEPAGFIPAPLGPATGASSFTGSASPGFTGSASSGFTGSAAGFTGSTAGFTGSGFAGSGSGFAGSGFTGSAMGFTRSGFSGSASPGLASAGPTSPGAGGLAAPGTAGISPPARIVPPAQAGSVPGGSSSAGLAGTGLGEAALARTELGGAALGGTGLGGTGLAGAGAGPAGRGLSPSSPPGGISPSASSPPGRISPSVGPATAAGLGPSAGIGPAAGIGPTGPLGPTAGPRASAVSDPSGRSSTPRGVGPARLGPSARLGSPAPSPDAAAPGNSPAPPAEEAASGVAKAGAAGASLPPWALISEKPGAEPGGSEAMPGGAFPGAPVGEAAGGQEPASGAGPGGANVTRTSSRLSQAPRQPRTPQVSGRPPWEPAPEPNSELPWAQAPVPSLGGAGLLPMREKVRPELPAWEEMAQEAWPGGPQVAGPHPPVPSAADPNGQPGRESGHPGAGRVLPAAGLTPPQPDSPKRPAGTGNRPGFAWNTGEGMEPFSAVRAEPGVVPHGPARAGDPHVGRTGAAQAGDNAPAGPASPGVSSSAASRPSASTPDDSSPAADRPSASPPSASPSAGSSSSARPSVVDPSSADPSAGSLPGVSRARRPGLTLPRRLGGSVARQAGGIAGAGGVNPGGTGPAGASTAGQVPASGGPSAAGPAGGGFTSSAATGFTAAGANLPGKGISHPPFPPAPRPAEPSTPSAAQPPFPPVPRPGVGAAPSSGTGAAFPLRATPGVTKLGVAKQPAAPPEAGTTRPKTGVPPWEITDSFLAVPPAEVRAMPAPGGALADQTGNPLGASSWGSVQAGSQPAGLRGTNTGDSRLGTGSQTGNVLGTNTRGGGPEPADQPVDPAGAHTSGGGLTAGSPPGNRPAETTADGGPTDNTENFAAVDSGADQRSSLRLNPGDSIESFPVTRPRADIEDAFRLFPPVRSTDKQPPEDGED